MNGFCLNMLMLVSAGWMPVADRDKSGTPGCEKRAVLANRLENQALQNAPFNTAERKGFSDRIIRWWRA